MSICPEVLPFLPAAVVFGLIVAGIAGLIARRRKPVLTAGAIATLLMAAGLLFFFRDPTRVIPSDPSAIVSGADGVVMQIVEEDDTELLNGQTVRLSVFLNLHNVHVNRTPIAGTVRFMRHTPGGKQPAWREDASVSNERNTLLIEGSHTRCVVHQICGMAARRTVSWLHVGQEIGKGERLGMMKFGSRLDMIFPRTDVTVLAREGDRVTAGETIVATLNKDSVP